MNEQQILAQISEYEYQIKRLIAMLPKDSVAYIYIAGEAFPCPAYGSSLFTVSTSVDAGINGNNQFVGTKLGRDRSKIELNWNYLDDATAKKMLNIFEKSFTNPVNYPDPVHGRITREMYVGDRTLRPFELNSIMNPKSWLDTKFNLVDTGR